MEKELEDNPVVEKLKALLREDRMMLEKICVQCEIKYPTFINVFQRQTVSVNTLKALKYAGIVSLDDERRYHKWVIDNDLVGVRSWPKKSA